MLNIKTILFKFKNLALISLSILLFSRIQLPTNKKTRHITVFIHGTFMPGLAFLNPFKTYNQTIDNNDRYYKCLKKLRLDPILYQDAIMLEEGLQKIDSTILSQYCQFNLMPAHSKKGAYQAIGAYDMIHKYINKTSLNNHEYYTFGFSGILSDQYRKEAGHDLYKELYKIVKKNSKDNYKTIINLCSYSHGGNVSLYLAQAEDYYKKNIKVDKLILYGTPIQKETALFVEHKIFKNVYSFYSQADGVQHNDSFSTSSSQSFKTFKEFYANNNCDNTKVIDIRLLAQDDPAIFGHFNFWYFNRYENWPNKSKEIDEVYTSLNPLPIAILTPIFIYLINKSSNIKELDISIKSEDQKLKIVLLDTINNQILCISPEINQLIEKIQNYAKTSWQPYSKADETTKLGVSILAALQSLIY